MKDSSQWRFSFVFLGCVIVFSLMGFVIGTVAGHTGSETITGGSSIQPQFVKSLSAWVYMPTPQGDQARIEIRSGADVTLPPAVVTGATGDVVRYSDKVSVEILDVDPGTADSPPGSGSVTIKIVNDPGSGPRILATSIGACVGAVCACVVWVVRKRMISRQG